jgi:tRNA A-37 threonylcarbamoyl transferase component Bud32
LKPLTLNEYQRLVDNSVILEEDGHGLKVLETSDGHIIKIFRQKRVVSSALIKPYASRFVKNAQVLKKLGIHTVDVVDMFYCPPIKRTLVKYRPIPGKTLRSVLHSSLHLDDVMESFVRFFAELHNKGVFFRSIHLNNVIVSDDLNTLGLIDFADMKIASKGLSRPMRLRNFKHLARYKADQESIKTFGLDRFIDIYFSCTSLPESAKMEFLAELQNVVATEGRV